MYKNKKGEIIGIIVTIIILILLYSFIFNKKSSIKILFIQYISLMA